MSDAMKMVLAVEVDRTSELTRRLGYAKRSIEDAILLIGTKDYWAEQTLRRALSVIAGETAGEVRQ
jgi:hypothetical protein